MKQLSLMTEKIIKHNKCNNMRQSAKFAKEIRLFSVALMSSHDYQSPQSLSSSKFCEMTQIKRYGMCVI